MRRSFWVAAAALVVMGLLFAASLSLSGKRGRDTALSGAEGNMRPIAPGAAAPPAPPPTSAAAGARPSPVPVPPPVQRTPAAPREVVQATPPPPTLLPPPPPAATQAPPPPAASGAIARHPDFSRPAYLVGVFVCNGWRITERFLRNMAAISDNIEVIVIDDASEDMTGEKARALGYTAEVNPEPRGVTYGMNRIYKFFKDDPRYEAVFTSNNDVIVPDGAFEEMAAVLREIKKPTIVGPMTTAAGLGISAMHGVEGNLDVRFPDTPKELVAGLPGTTTELNAWLRAHSGPRYVPAKWVLGFMMGTDRHMASAELSPGVLLGGRGLNLGQEDEMFENRMPPSRRIVPHIARHVFIYHDKGATLKLSDNRDEIMTCHRKPAT